MREVYVVSAVRTPIGRFGGALKHHSPVDLAAHTMSAVLERGGVSGGDIDLYSFGNILSAGHGQLIPRQAALKAGIPESVDGIAIDMVCSAGMMSLITSTSMIRAGDCDVVIAGGVESMSGTGFFLSSRARWGYQFLMGSPEQLTDLLLYDGLTDPMSEEAMGFQTERVAEKHGISRRELDEVAVASHERAVGAREEGRFDDEIIPIEYRIKRETRTLDYDEGVREGTSIESLSNLRPAFKSDGVLTAGNSSQISDGSAALLLASAEAVERLDLNPIAKVLGGSWSATESWLFAEAPIPAATKLNERLGLTISDYGLFENNEAFAINNLLFNRMLDVPMDRLNVHGGAVALGHPIGCSGARIIVTLIHALKTHDEHRGLAAICHGTGGGTAVAVERV